MQTKFQSESILSHATVRFLGVYAKAGIFLIATTVLFASYCSAANYSWTVTSGDWSDAANWGGTVPTSSNSAFIDNGGTATFASVGAFCNNLYLGYASGESGAVEMIAGKLNSNSCEYVGYSGIGSFVQSGGSNIISSTLVLGNLSGSSGSYFLSDGLLSATSESIGYQGNATFAQTGGTNSVSNGLRLGNYSHSTGIYTLSGGLLSTSYEWIGDYGLGKFIQTGGTNTIAGNFDFGDRIGSQGIYTLSGGALQITSGGTLGIGSSYGTGRFEWYGGSITAPKITLSNNGTLAIGFDFQMDALVSGALFGGTSFRAYPKTQFVSK